MKRKIILILTLALIVFLPACQALTASSTSQASSSSASSQSYQWTELAVGTLMLDDSSYPVDAGEATSLLPLWKAARSLNKSDTAATVEIAGLLKQIQSTLSSDQVKAIQTMDMSSQKLPESIQALGIQVGGQIPPSGANPPAGTPSAAAAGGGPGGIPGGDFSGMPGGGPPGAQTTQYATTKTNTTLGVSSDLLEAVITFLNAKVQ